MVIFNDNVSEELREILSIELHRYKREIPDMTYNELLMVEDWVGAGNSPYTNGDYVCDDDGWPLDYINTIRGWQAMAEELETGSSSEQEANAATPDFIKDLSFEDPFGAQ